MPDGIGETIEIGVCSKQWSGIVEAFSDRDFFNIRCKTQLFIFIPTKEYWHHHSVMFFYHIIFS